jgi:hypothetical protein
VSLIIKMEKLTHKPSILFRLYLFAIYLIGDAFLIWAIFKIVFNITNKETIVNLTGGTPIFLFALVWNIIFLYFILNSPYSFTVSVKGLKISWRKNSERLYLWKDVQLKSIGLNPKPMIIVQDEKWKILGFEIPRLLSANKDIIKQIRYYKPSQNSDN